MKFTKLRYRIGPLIVLQKATAEGNKLEVEVTGLKSQLSQSREDHAAAVKANGEVSQELELAKTDNVTSEQKCNQATAALGEANVALQQATATSWRSRSLGSRLSCCSLVRITPQP